MSSESRPAGSATDANDWLEARMAELQAFRTALVEESDRGCALMAASFLDTLLQQLLRASMVADGNVFNEFVRPDGPLASFSARIDLAYLLGHIDTDARRDLHLIRKIRNEFGHNAGRLTFGTPAHAGRCRELRYTAWGAEEPPRHRFINTVMGLSGVLHARTAAATHAVVPPSVAPDGEMRRFMQEWVEARRRELTQAADELVAQGSPIGGSEPTPGRRGEPDSSRP